MNKLVDDVTKKIHDEYVKSMQYCDLDDELTCFVCFELLCNPVPMICGHYCCTTCFEIRTSKCKRCYSEIRKSPSPSKNVILSVVLQKLLPREYKYRDLINEGDILCDKKLPEDAILKYTAATELCPDNHAAFHKRASAHTACGNLKQSIQDSFHSMVLERRNPEVYLVLGETLLGVGKSKEAFYNFAVCLALDPLHVKARKNMISEIKKLLSSGINKREPTLRDVESPWSEENVNEPLIKETFMELRKDIWDGLNDFLIALEDGEDPRARNFWTEVVCSAIDESDMECALCMRLFHEPISKICGHVFCSGCVARSLDHSPSCPICKQETSDVLSIPPIDRTMETIIKRLLPEQYEERLHQHEIDNAELRKSIPVMACSVSFPAVSCKMEIFEPRYRSMLRRAIIVHDKHFGHCGMSDSDLFHEIGTELYIKSVTFSNDGRSSLDTIGTRRFRVLSRGVCEGYETAEVEYFADIPMDPDEYHELDNISQVLYARFQDWFAKQQFQFRELVNSYYGALPERDDITKEDGPNWSWWVFAVLPGSDNLKLHVLRQRKLRERLSIIGRLLTAMERKQHKA